MAPTKRTVTSATKDRVLSPKGSSIRVAKSAYAVKPHGKAFRNMRLYPFKDVGDGSLDLADSEADMFDDECFPYFDDSETEQEDLKEEPKIKHSSHSSDDVTGIPQHPVTIKQGKKSRSDEINMWDLPQWPGVAQQEVPKAKRRGEVNIRDLPQWSGAAQQEVPKVKKHRDEVNLYDIPQLPGTMEGAVKKRSNEINLHDLPQWRGAAQQEAPKAKGRGEVNLHDIPLRPEPIEEAVKERSNESSIWDLPQLPGYQSNFWDLPQWPGHQGNDIGRDILNDMADARGVDVEAGYRNMDGEYFHPAYPMLPADIELPPHGFEFDGMHLSGNPLREWHTNVRRELLQAQLIELATSGEMETLGFALAHRRQLFGTSRVF